MNRSWKHLAAAAIATIVVATPARAQWSVTPYIWATDLDVDLSVNGDPVVDEHIAFGDLIDDVKLAAMVRVEYQAGRAGALFDLFYVRMGSDGNTVPLPEGRTATADAQIDMAVIDAIAAFGFRRDGGGLAILVGARALAQRTAVTLDLALDADHSVRHEIEQSDVLVDPMVGLRFRGRLGRRWFTESRADVSTGGTDMTWSVGSQLTYALSSRVALNAGYRRLEIDYRDSDPVDAGMAMSGLITGARIRF